MKTTWALAVLTLAALGASPARAGEPAPVPDATTRAVAAALDAATTRAKAKMEEARILESLGRREEALAALKEVDAISREGKALAERLLGVPASDRRAAPPPSAPPPFVGIGPRSTSPASKPATASALAARWLMSRQHADGAFRRPTGDDDASPGSPGDPIDVASTALAAVALYEVVDDAAPEPAILEAARRAVEALLARQSRDAGAFGDLEEHALATWAVATGFSRTGELAWREPLRRAVVHALGARDATGLWSLPPLGGADDATIASAFMVVALHEVAAMPALAKELDVDAAITRASLAAAASDAPRAPTGRSPVAAVAHALLAHGARAAGVATDDDSTPPRVEVTADGRVFATAILLGSAAARDAQGGDAWYDDVVARALGVQATTPGLAGSWAGADSRSRAHGRVWATAAMILAERAPFATWTEPHGT